MATVIKRKEIGQLKIEPIKDEDVPVLYPYVDPGWVMRPSSVLDFSSIE